MLLVSYHAYYSGLLQNIYLLNMKSTQPYPSSVDLGTSHGTRVIETQVPICLIHIFSLKYPELYSSSIGSGTSHSTRVIETWVPICLSPIYLLQTYLLALTTVMSVQWMVLEFCELEYLSTKIPLPAFSYFQYLCYLFLVSHFPVHVMSQNARVKAEPVLLGHHLQVSVLVSPSKTNVMSINLWVLPAVIST